MATKQFGFDLLSSQISEWIAGEIDWQKQDGAFGDTPIERLFLLALSWTIRIGSVEHQALIIEGEDDHNLRYAKDERTCLFIRRQVQHEAGWRVDFVVRAYDFGRRSGREGWREAIIECDGHGFHERTKEQAARDRARDRTAQIGGTPVFRFTGSELWRDPMGCARQIVDWAVEGWL